MVSNQTMLALHLTTQVFKCNFNYFFFFLHCFQNEHLSSFFLLDNAFLIKVFSLSLYLYRISQILMWKLSKNWDNPSYSPRPLKSPLSNNKIFSVKSESRDVKTITNTFQGLIVPFLAIFEVFAYNFSVSEIGCLIYAHL